MIRRIIQSPRRQRRTLSVRAPVVVPSLGILAFALAGCAEDQVVGPTRELPTRLPSVTVSTGVNGKIAFVSNRIVVGNYDLYMMDPDGNNQTQLTTHLAADVYPAWGPDGHRLAFTSYRDGNYEIYVMNASCTNLAPARLTNNSAGDADPSWSPDGSKIAFTSDRDGARQIYVMNADGSGQINVSNDITFGDEEPHWSADGTKMAFARGGDVFVMNANGTGKTNLTNAVGNDTPMAWSPDGSKILFASTRDLASYELYVMNASDGSNVVRLTTNTLPEYPASWSPDGTKIIFNLDGNIYTMNANGTGQVQVTTTGLETSPDWGPQPAAPSNCNNVAPVIGTITAPVAPVALGSNVTVSWTFTDPDTDTWTCQIEWDTGAGFTAATYSAPNTCSVSAQLAAGLYSARVRVSDGSSEDIDAVPLYIVVYDPNGGFVTGGGWITSPAGAYAADLTLTGRANFGFVSKYERNKTLPQGNTEFQFQAGNLNFTSTSYEWLVVSGPLGQYRGVGTINGAGNYGFLLTARDGQVTGGGGIDKFRIKIWVIGGAVVYDNVVGAAEDSGAGTELGGGSIVIHSKK